MRKKVDFGSLKLDVKNIMSIFTAASVMATRIDKLRTTFTKHMQKRHIPSRMTSLRFSQPWITREYKRSVEKRDHTTNSIR